MPGPIDDTLKHLTELSPQDWVVRGGWPAAPATLIDADIATLTGATDKVLRVGGRGEAHDPRCSDSANLRNMRGLCGAWHPRQLDLADSPRMSLVPPSPGGRIKEERARSV